MSSWDGTNEYLCSLFLAGLSLTETVMLLVLSFYPPWTEARSNKYVWGESFVLWFLIFICFLLFHRKIAQLPRNYRKSETFLAPDILVRYWNGKVHEHSFGGITELTSSAPRLISTNPQARRDVSGNTPWGPVSARQEVPCFLHLQSTPLIKSLFKTYLSVICQLHTRSYTTTQVPLARGDFDGS